jgi:hypothetical protein
MEQQLTGLQTLLDVPYIRRTRRNHGLEHATIHVLSQRVKDLRVVGRSDSRGFWLFGDIATENVETCVAAALQRMQNGEHDLAIHPNCGTNLVTTAMIGTAATMVALAGSEREFGGKVARIPLIVMGLMFATLFGQPAGRKMQEHVTTLGDPSDLKVLEIRPTRRGGMMAHRVETTSS